MDFRQRVEELVSQIPHGKVMTYGQIAAMCGNPRAARVVGGVAHYGDSKLPWHRVVNKSGGTASGYPGGKSEHQKLLESEGIIIDNFRIKNIEEYQWHPK